MKIFLVGFMGCGKSFIARNLAPKLGMEVLDLDKYIEEQTGHSIPEIFRTEGESAFRRIEQAHLHQLADLENTVISTGGGAPCFFDNMEWMNAQGTTIFLDVAIPLLAARLRTSRHDRPLIAGKNSEELSQFIAAKLEERRPFYEQADIIQEQFDADYDRVGELAAFLKASNVKDL